PGRRRRARRAGGPLPAGTAARRGQPGSPRAPVRFVSPGRGKPHGDDRREVSRVSSILQSLLSGLTVAISYVPKVVGALLVLLIGYVIARLLRAATRKLLQKFRFDERMKSGHGGEYVERFSPQ